MPKKTPAPSLLNHSSIDQIFQRLASVNPAPKTELEFVNHYTLLVAIVLSAQATDIMVNKATRTLFAVVTTPAEMLALGEDGLKNHIKIIGLFNTKAKNIILLSQMLIEKHAATVPQDFASLISLPGVGRKTANVFLNCALGAHTIAVDTHVFRVSNRLGLTSAKNVLESEQALNEAIGASWKQYAHHWLILHGRYICTARKPKCQLCPLSDLCLYSTSAR